MESKLIKYISFQLKKLSRYLKFGTNFVTSRIWPLSMTNNKEIVYFLSWPLMFSVDTFKILCEYFGTIGSGQDNSSWVVVEGESCALHSPVHYTMLVLDSIPGLYTLDVCSIPSSVTTKNAFGIVNWRVVLGWEPLLYMFEDHSLMCNHLN